MALKKIPNLAIDENIKYDSLFQNNAENYYKTNPINKKDIISNTKLESNINENNLKDIKEEEKQNEEEKKEEEKKEEKPEEKKEEEKNIEKLEKQIKPIIERMSLELYKKQPENIVN